MLNNFQMFRDDEVMAVATFAGALLFMCVGQYEFASSMIFGYVAGEIAYYLNGGSEGAHSKAYIHSRTAAEEKSSGDRAA